MTEAESLSLLEKRVICALTDNTSQFAQNVENRALGGASVPASRGNLRLRQPGSCGRSPHRVFFRCSLGFRSQVVGPDHFSREQVADNRNPFPLTPDTFFDHAETH